MGETKGPPFLTKWRADLHRNKIRCFSCEEKRRHLFRMLQAELVPRIHPFRRECGADSSSSDLHSGNQTLCFPRPFPAFSRINPQDWLSPRQLSLLRNRSCAHSSGRVVFPFSCAEACPAACFGYCTSDGNIKLLEKAKSCAFPSATIHDMGVICKRFEKNIPHLSHPLEKSRKLCQNKENRPGGVLTAQRLDATN